MAAPRRAVRARWRRRLHPGLGSTARGGCPPAGREPWTLPCLRLPIAGGAGGGTRASPDALVGETRALFMGAARLRVLVPGSGLLHTSCDGV